MTREGNAILVVQRQYDATPCRVRFGQLQSQLEPHARYPSWDETTQRWSMLELDAYREATNRTHAMRFGTVEVLGQGLSVHKFSKSSLSSAGRIEGFRIIAPARILQRANSSCIYSATEELCPQLSTSASGLGELRKSCHAILLNELPDACKSNGRKRAQTVADCADYDNVYSTRATCGCHQGHRVVEGPEKRTVGNVFAIAYTCAAVTVQTRLLNAFKLWLQKLVLVRGEPDPAVTKRNRMIMRHTFRRRGCVVAGINTFDGESAPDRSQADLPADGGHAMHEVDDDELLADTDATEQDDLGEAAEHFLLCWNGDWTSPVLICHDTRGWTIQEAQDMLYASACQLDLFQSSDCHLPSADDWGSCGASCGRTALGMLCHNVYGQVFPAGCPSWDEIGAMDVDDDDADDARDKRVLLQK